MLDVFVHWEANHLNDFKVSDLD